MSVWNVSDTCMRVEREYQPWLPEHGRTYLMVSLTAVSWLHVVVRIPEVGEFLPDCLFSKVSNASAGMYLPHEYGVPGLLSGSRLAIMIAHEKQTASRCVNLRTA